jgi:hypothetical protein
MDRRQFVGYGLGAGLSTASLPTWAADKWGKDQGYPTGWNGRFARLPEY